MAKQALIVPHPTAFLVLLGLLLTPGGNVKLSDGQKTWCVAKASTDGVALQNNINFACSSVDCSSIQEGGPCFQPNIVISHASVAMNLYYKSRGMNTWNCYFDGSALIVITDPSYGDCKYV